MAPRERATEQIHLRRIFSATSKKSLGSQESSTETLYLDWVITTSHIFTINSLGFPSRGEENIHIFICLQKSFVLVKGGYISSDKVQTQVGLRPMPVYII